MDMKNGKYKDGEVVLRAKIDMGSPNINYAWSNYLSSSSCAPSPNGDKWCVYPMYDFTHCLSDAIEKWRTLSVTLEFQDHRPLYDWVLDTLKTAHPQQIEFARLNLNYTVTSKRKLKQLVDEKHVHGLGWSADADDFWFASSWLYALSIRNFLRSYWCGQNLTVRLMSVCGTRYSWDLDASANRPWLCWIRSKVTLTNYPEGKEGNLTVGNHPKMKKRGTRQVPLVKSVHWRRRTCRSGRLVNGSA